MLEGRAEMHCGDNSYIVNKGEMIIVEKTGCGNIWAACLSESTDYQ